MTTFIDDGGMIIASKVDFRIKFRAEASLDSGSKAQVLRSGFYFIMPELQVSGSILFHIKKLH